MLDLQIFQTPEKIMPSNSMLLLQEAGACKSYMLPEEAKFCF
jgi:hypothetical protein